MKKYWLIFLTNWQASLEYRFNFLLGRLQNIILLLTLYFLWQAVFANQTTLFGFNREQILTYVLGAHILRSLVLDTRTKFIGEEIYNGHISFVLLKPINYFYQWLAEDFARKVMTVITSIFEIAIFVWLVKPSIFIQPSHTLILLTIFSIILAAFLNFIVNFAAALVGFWSDNVYGPHFLVEVFIDFASGSLFPLDALPAPLVGFLQALPFYYVLYFPLKIYLGQLGLHTIILGLTLQMIWTGVMFVAYRLVWNKGLKHYAAVGG